GRRIVNRIASSAEVKIPGVHLGAWHVAYERFRYLFMMPLKAAEEEGLVFAIVEMRDLDRPAGDRAHLVIRERIARDDRVREHRRLAAAQLLEILPMDELAVEVAIFRAAVELIGAALHDSR